MVRESESTPGAFVVVIFTGGVVKDHKIILQPGPYGMMYCINLGRSTATGETLGFDTLSELMKEVCKQHQIANAVVAALNGPGLPKSESLSYDEAEAFGGFGPGDDADNGFC